MQQFCSSIVLLKLLTISLSVQDQTVDFTLKLSFFLVLRIFAKITKAPETPFPIPHLVILATPFFKFTSFTKISQILRSTSLGGKLS
jgi:hypothetical protein